MTDTQQVDLFAGTTVDSVRALSDALPERLGFDTETHLISPGLMAPRIVCASFAFYNAEIGQVDGTADDNTSPRMMAMIEEMLDGPELVLGQNLAFDLAVLCKNYPHLIPAVFKKLEAGGMVCIKVREKILALATSGVIDFAETEDEDFGEEDEGSSDRVQGARKRIYSLDEMVLDYMGIDISGDKKDEDAWRLHYSTLDGTPIESWPTEAVEYAIKDAAYLLPIFDGQEQKRLRLVEERGYDPLPPGLAEFKTLVDFSLFLLTCHPAKVDNEYKHEVMDWVAKELAPERLQLLVDNGILRPGEDPRPKRGNKNGELTKGKKPSINTTVWKEFIVTLATMDPRVSLVRTAPSQRFPEGQISTKRDWLLQHSHFHPVLEQYAHRQKLQKLVTTDLPRMSVRGADGEIIGDAEFVHTNYDVLKRTGRTSSYASKKYPSFNSQNPHPKTRGCIVARKGRVLWSSDLSFMELVTFGQTCLWMLGYSRLAEIINDGKDPHAWLGAQIANRLSDHFIGRFGQGLSQDDAAEAFLQMKVGSDDDKACFKKFRTFAKPTGLGYPGGLGPNTFIAFAKATYDLAIDLETAKALREIWMEAFPEAPEYFRFINDNLIDQWNRAPAREDGRPNQFYWYASPMGMVRVGADYCAAANGLGLQTPGAEGATLGLTSVVRACYDPSLGSVLYGKTYPLFFIHDELFGEMDEDDQMHERCNEIKRLQEESFRIITPDVRIKAAPCLMRRWDKAAEPVFDANNRLTIWEPKKK